MSSKAIQSNLNLSQLGLSDYRLQILELQNELKKAPQVKTPVFHKFYPGYYIRTMMIPAGTLIIGMKHKVRSANVVLEGKIEIIIDGELREFSAGQRFLSYPGSKKVGIASEDTLFANIFETDETDFDKLEDICIYTEHEELELMHDELKELL